MVEELGKAAGFVIAAIGVCLVIAALMAATRWLFEYAVG